MNNTPKQSGAFDLDDGCPQVTAQVSRALIRLFCSKLGKGDRYRLAEELGVSRPYISQILSPSDAARPMGPGAIQKIARALSVPLEDVVSAMRSDVPDYLARIAVYFVPDSRVIGLMLEAVLRAK